MQLALSRDGQTEVLLKVLSTSSVFILEHKGTYLSRHRPATHQSSCNTALVVYLTRVSSVALGGGGGGSGRGDDVSGF